jgi:nicotinamidase-related amidase
MDALKLGFTVFLVREACRGIDQPPGSLEERLAEMRAAGVRLAGADEA